MKSGNRATLTIVGPEVSVLFWQVVLKNFIVLSDSKHNSLSNYRYAQFTWSNVITVSTFFSHKIRVNNYH